MGLSYNIYLGPYASLTVKKGKRHPHQAVEDLHIVDVFSFTERGEKKNTYVFFPNMHRKPPREFHFYVKSESFIEVGANEMFQCAERLWFELAFGPELTLLSEYYGHGNVEFHWGFLSYIW